MQCGETRKGGIAGAVCGECCERALKHWLTEGVVFTCSHAKNKPICRQDVALTINVTLEARAANVLGRASPVVARATVARVCAGRRSARAVLVTKPVTGAAHLHRTEIVVVIFAAPGTVHIVCSAALAVRIERTFVRVNAGSISRVITVRVIARARAAGATAARTALRARTQERDSRIRLFVRHEQKAAFTRHSIGGVIIVVVCERFGTHA